MWWLRTCLVLCSLWLWVCPALGVILHHYTTSGGYAAIKASRVIRASDTAGLDAAFGSGVYLTSLGPQEDLMEIAGNNWDGGKLTKRAILAAGKVNQGFQVLIPSSDPLLRQIDAGTRDVYLYEGDLYLDDYQHTPFRVEVSGNTKTIRSNGQFHATSIDGGFDGNLVFSGKGA